MEEWKYGGIYFCDENVNVEYYPVKMKEVVNFVIDLSNLTPEQAMDKILREVKEVDISDKIVTLRVKGEIQGKTSDVNFQAIYEHLKEAYIVLKNTHKLSSAISNTITMKEGTVEEIEQEIIKESVTEVKIKDMTPEMENLFTKKLMEVLARDKGEGEKVGDFERRVLSEAIEVLEIEDP